MTTEIGPDEGARELQELLQFFYQCPVGLIEIDDRGEIRKVNPAAARMLAPALDGRGLQEVFGLFARLCPVLVETITARPETRGPLGAAVRMPVPGRAGTEDWLELSTVRVERDRVMITIVDVSQERRLAQREHELVVRIQHSMMGRIDITAGLDVSVTYRPAEIDQLVGGDWYDLIELPEDRVGLAVGDVAGHNVEAAVTMGQLRSAVRGMAPWCLDPGELLHRADEIAGRMDGTSFVTMAYATFDAAEDELRYACRSSAATVGAVRRVERVLDGRAAVSVGLLAPGNGGHGPGSARDGGSSGALQRRTDRAPRRGPPPRHGAAAKGRRHGAGLVLPGHR